jgi:hypothetical protein
MQESQLPPHRRNIQDPLCDSSMFMASIYVLCLTYLSEEHIFYHRLMENARYDAISGTLPEYVSET